LILCIISIFISSILFMEIFSQSEKEYNITLGNNYILNKSIPTLISISDMTKDSILKIIPVDQSKLKINRSFKFEPLDIGTVNVNFKAFGIVPYKNIKVNVVPQIKVIPGGHPIGVRLNTDGVLVVGTANVTDIYGNTHNIAEKEGIKVGDILLSIDGTKIINARHVEEILNLHEGKELDFTFIRDARKYTVKLHPVKSIDDNKFRLGLWIRDKTSGVGTITFYHPSSKKFGALGHPITDIDTGNILSLRDGEIIKSKIISIEEGKKGKPGEIKGVFYDVNKPLGKLEKNNRLGVFGILNEEIKNDFYTEEIPIAYQHEIKEGPAHILTTINSRGMEKYEIEILKIIPQSKIDDKSMIIRVTDKELLKHTGGIVQGMSGSPIIQNNKLIGAVTHVLINDPTKGYGVFIEWMIEESGLFNE